MKVEKPRRANPMTKFEKLVETTVMNFLRDYDESIKDPDEDYAFDKLSEQVKFETDPDGFMIMRIDGTLWELMNTDGFDTEFGFFVNEFPEKFAYALALAGLFFEPWSSDTYHIYGLFSDFFKG
jgi:hypothetical protein